MDYAIGISRNWRHHRIDVIQKLPLKPDEYCRRWIPKIKGIEPTDWGYRKVCVKELAKLTSLSESTVNSWGPNFEKAPSYVESVCRLADVLNQIREKATLSDDFFDE
jgi:hypothetical protein